MNDFIIYRNDQFTLSYVNPHHPQGFTHLLEVTDTRTGEKITGMWIDPTESSSRTFNAVNRLENLQGSDTYYQEVANFIELLIENGGFSSLLISTLMADTLRYHTNPLQLYQTVEAVDVSNLRRRNEDQLLAWADLKDRLTDLFDPENENPLPDLADLQDQLPDLFDLENENPPPDFDLPSHQEIKFFTRGFIEILKEFIQNLFNLEARTNPISYESFPADEKDEKSVGRMEVCAQIPRPEEKATVTSLSGNSFYPPPRVCRKRTRTDAAENEDLDQGSKLPSRNCSAKR